MKNLFYHEYLVQNKVHNLTKYNVLFFIFCIIGTSVINSAEDFEKLGKVFSVVYIPLSFLALGANIFKYDIDDGSFELTAAASSSMQIILSKYSVLSLNSCVSFILISPLLKIFFNLSLHDLFFLLCPAILLILLSSALIILIASIQSYFKSNTDFLSVLIMPLLIPNIIMAGIFMQGMEEFFLLYIMIGINLIIIPPSLYLSGYLIENIYNI